jgi:hypothetical protein
MSKHILFGTDKRLRPENLEYGRTAYGASSRRDPHGAPVRPPADPGRRP